MTDEELIARLLDWEEYDEGDINDAREAAANRIKELKAELAGGNLPTKLVLADLYEAQAAEIKRLRGNVEKMIGGADTVLEAWDHHMRDVVVPGTLHDAIEELRADVAEVNGGNDAKGNM